MSQQDSASPFSSAAMWCLAFLLPLPAQSAAIKEAAAAASSALADKTSAAAVYNAAVLEAVGYGKAGEQLRQALQRSASETLETAPTAGAAQPQSWPDLLAATMLRHSEKLFSSASSSAHAALVDILQETQRAYEKQQQPTTPSSPCDSLFASLAFEYLHLTHPDAPHVTAALRCPTIFQCRPADAPTESAATKAHQRAWYEARLFAALACASSIRTPGPLVRLLVAYAHLSDGRLRHVVEQNLAAHLSAISAATAVDVRTSTAAEAVGRAAESAVSSEAAALTRMRLSGIVAGVLEYALHIARVRSSLAVTVLSSCTASSGISAGASSSSTSGSPAALLSCSAKVPQSAAQLLIQLTEECGHYQQSGASAPAANAPAATVATASTTTVALATVHAVQELLFTLVLGNGTQHMPNRPVPAAPKRVSAMPEPVVSKADHAAPPLLVSTRRAMSLQEADAIAQELFPALVQQLGLEWPWSPLLRHLSSLDKVQPPPPTASSAAEADKSKEAPVQTAHAAAPLPIRWSSHLLLDTVLLSLARKVYPQRLLNILPGSFERLLERLDLLPPVQQQQQQGDEAGEVVAVGAGGAAGGPALFDMPAYYAEPGAAVVTYLQRAGVSGVRVEEVERILSTSVSTYSMIVRLRAQAPPRAEAEDGGALDDDADEAKATAGGMEKRAKTESTTYALSRERVQHLISRYEAEVLLAAVVVYTQLRIPSQVQQLMRTLAPLFLKIHLTWRTHHDGSIASWLLQQRNSSGADAAAGDAQSVRFSAEAAVLLDKVGYEFYPLEWLPSVTARMVASRTASFTSTTGNVALPYSLCAAVSHQLRLHLRGTPLGSSGYATQCHPAGPRASVVMPSDNGLVSLFSGQDGHASDAKASVAAWRRSERFLTGLMQLCYLDTKTSSAELEGTLAVSSTRRVLTTGSGGAGASTGSSSATVGGTHVVAAADVAAQRLRSLLQQPAVMNAMWGSMEGHVAKGSGGAAAAATGARYGGEKRPRFPSSSAASSADAEEQLRSLQQLLREYGASSFDTTVEAADFALTIAQSFLPCTAGVSTAAKSSKKSSDVLLRNAVEWCRAAAGLPADKARINMLLQQQQQQQQQQPSTSSCLIEPLASAYNSVTVDAAWLARSVLRQVPRRIWEKLHVQQAEAEAMAQRHAKWSSRLMQQSAAVGSVTAQVADASREVHHRVDALLWEQWTQWQRVLQQLALVDTSDGGGSAFLAQPVATADEMSCAQWLWYSPFFATEWSAKAV